MHNEKKRLGLSAQSASKERHIIRDNRSGRNQGITVKIVLYVNSFLPTVGGRELVVFHLARTLKTLGHDVRVLGPAGWRERRRLNVFEFPVHRQPATAGFPIWNKYAKDSNKRGGIRGLIEEKTKQLQLFWNLKRWGCDVIHAHSTYPNGYNAARLRRMLNVPLVVTPHGEDINTVPDIGFGLRLNPLLDSRIRFALQHADAITAISASVERSIVEAGAPPERVHRISNGVDVSRFDKAQSADISHWLGPDKRVKLITSVGTNRSCKGHEITIRAMPYILAHEPRARLVIVGRGTEALQCLVDDLGLTHHVVLAGSVEVPLRRQVADHLASLLCSSRLYVSSSIGEGAEGLSLAILEAMAAGLPVVATRISGNRDVIIDGHNGLLIEPGDPSLLAGAVVKLLSEEEMRAEKGRRAKALAKRFDWPGIACEYVALYRRLAEARQRCPAAHQTTS